MSIQLEIIKSKSEEGVAMSGNSILNSAKYSSNNTDGCCCKVET